MSAPDISVSARWLQARHGMYVFPVDHPGLPRCAGWHHADEPYYDKNGRHQRGKHPACKWSRDATLDPDEIGAMLSRGLRNLAIACRPSRLLVVDEDRPGAYAAYAAEIGQTIEPTFCVATSKGHHHYYRQPEGEPLGNGVGALAARGIDIRGAKGNGGYVVGPGSVHETGVIYAPVDSSVPILPVPVWLAEALRAERPKSAMPENCRPVRRRGGGRPYKVLTGLVQAVLDATPGTDRNSRLYWAACRAFEHAGTGLFPAPDARAALLDAARHIGLSDGEAEATLDSAQTMTGGTR
ncbi:MAG: hypothetical protein JWO67_7001 [Streptosporangiaceae bacterium]|nr:hypothetical protein [Streptosporangiaceae bacterium]